MVSPNKQALERWAEENGVTGDFSSLCENHLAKAHVLAELSKTAKAKKVTDKSIARQSFPDSHIHTKIFLLLTAEGLRVHQSCPP